MNELVAAATELDVDPGIGCIVITGSERAFAAGADIKEMQALGYPEVYVDDLFRGWDRLSDVRTPIIAAVAGHALGGGCELAMLCDILIAADNARFGQPEIRLGVIPGIGGSQRLTRAIGKAKAMDMCLTGTTITAQEADSRGLVSTGRPTGGSSRRDAQRGRDNRLDEPAGRDDGKGGSQPRVRNNSQRGGQVRAAGLSCDLRHR